MKAENCLKAIEEHMNKFGKLDILVNNASKQIQSESLEEIDVSLALTCRSALLLLCL